MGYVFDFHDARAYAQWAFQQRNQWTAAMENELMLNLLEPKKGESILNIGCGTGASSMPLLEMGLSVTGIDPSPYMLDICHSHLGNRVDLYRGYAEDLPFDDNTFNHAFFFFSLEFVEDPIKAMQEACRVAKDKVFIGFLNRFALKGVRLRLQGIFTPTIYNRARLFNIWELKRIAREAAGPVPIAWRTICQMPNVSAKVLRSIEKSDIVQRCPFGAFGGMTATLIPRFRTRPLSLRYNERNNHALITGSAPVRPITCRRRRPAEDVPRVDCDKVAAG